MFSNSRAGARNTLEQGAVAEHLEGVGLLWALLLPYCCSSSHPSQCFVGTLPGTSPPPWLGSVPQHAAASDMDNKPSPGACGSVWRPAVAFLGKPAAQPFPAWESALWRAGCAQPKTSPSFSSSHVKLFKRPLSAASTCNGCQVLFLSDNLWNLSNLWPRSGKRARKVIKST